MPIHQSTKRERVKALPAHSSTRSRFVLRQGSADRNHASCSNGRHQARARSATRGAAIGRGQITHAKQQQTLDALPTVEVVDAVESHLAHLADQLQNAPPAQLKDLLASLISRLTVNLETKDVEAYLTIPPWSSLNGDKPLCLGPSSRSSTESETHAAEHAIARIIGEYSIKASRVCYRCRRAAWTAEASN